ncbi:TetR/AcrR family transcriptional regulator [Corynebacterium lubricantis]|uniref:TetR/AcrR family transcriptional regulator n=1 Tax=Corynebacterium lubricantis TaxID=541095 RepID=UPI000375CB2B|nr:TetR/AcrR family transcriptional regulator [Corynebacterium lubricantis]
MTGKNAPRTMRADAVRNMQKIRNAAVGVFREQGLAAPIEEIARRAGVRPGTVYNRFGSREGLIDDVVPDLAAAALGQATQSALAFDDPWEGFVYYLTRIGEIQAENAALSDAVTRRYIETEHLTHACDVSRSREQEIINRAVQGGSLRADFTLEDVQLIFWSTAEIIRSTDEIAPNAWRRHLAFILDGLRAGAAHPSGVEALSPEQVQKIRLKLGSDGA